MLKLAIFDMAGTTVQDRGEVPRAFAAALAEFGVVVSVENLKAVRGASKRQAVSQLLPDTPDKPKLADQAYRAFCATLSRRYEESGVAAIPGAADVFDWFREHGVLVALNTGFDREITDLLLRALKWDSGVVDAVVCGNEVSQGRPAPDMILQVMGRTGVRDPAFVLNVGDTVMDLGAAAAAGVRWNVGVLSGAHDRVTLSAVPHTHLLPSIRELLELPIRESFWAEESGRK